MKNTTIPFVIVALVAISMQPAGAAKDLPMLSCTEALTTTLVPMPMTCDTIADPQSKLEKLNCTMRHRSRMGDLWAIEAEFAAARYNYSIHGNISSCASLIGWTGNAAHQGSHYVIKFDPFLFVGLAKTICGISRGEDCTYEMHLRADVASLPPLTFTPEDYLFWNFSSPLFRAGLEWVHFMSARAHVREHYPVAVPGLSGSYITNLMLIGSFGTDIKGDLPHLDHLPFLTELILIDSSRTDFTQDEFFETANINTLYLIENRFLEIPRAVAQLKNLKLLTFQSTKPHFKLIPTSLRGLENMEQLDLSGTPIEQWVGEFPKLPKLTELLLNHCQLKRFSVSQSYLPELLSLDLGENSLSSLSPDSFEGLNKLVTVNLSFNFISELSPEMFITFRDLKQVYLESNKLSKWPNLPCNRFFEITISQNFINSLINLGHHIIKVDRIDISNNRISTWDDNIFMKETECQEEDGLLIDGSMNISRSNSPDLLPQPWALTVNLSNNHIAIFSEAMLLSLSVLEEVDLGGNMINCGDCRTSLLQQWLSSTKTRVMNLGEGRPLTCYQPPELKGRMLHLVNFEEVCFIPRRYLWLGIGAPIAGVLAFVLIGSAIFYYRTEVVYLVHLAKIRATSKKKKSGRASLYDAFVCYSGKNRKWVLRRLAPLLERRPENYTLCLFDRDFSLGSHIVTNIVDAIEQSRKVIVVLTQHFIESKWCQWELEMAQHKLFSEDREFLVLLELEPLERRRLPRLLRFLLDTRPVVRWPRPETAPAVLAAAAQLHGALGPSLRQCPPPAPRPGEEPGPSASAPHERTPLLAN